MKKTRRKTQAKMSAQNQTGNRASAAKNTRALWVRVVAGGVALLLVAGIVVSAFMV